MFHRVRRPDGSRADIERGPGPVGIQPGKTITGWGVEVEALVIQRNDPRKRPGDSMTERAQYLRAYKARQK